MLSVSSIYRYKNFVRLIEAYRELARLRPGIPDLVIIGDDMRFAERPWTASPPYEPNGLVVGGPLDDVPTLQAVEELVRDRGDAAHRSPRRRRCAVHRE